MATVLYDLASTSHEASERLYENKFDLTRRALLKSAINYYSQVIELLCISDIDLMGRTLGMLGNCFHRLDDYTSAIFYHHQRLDLARRTYDIYAEARANYNLGNAYIGLDKPLFAETYFNTAADLCPSAVNLFTAAVVLQANGKYKQAIDKFNAVLACDDSSLHTSPTFNGSMLEKQRDYLKACNGLTSSETNALQFDRQTDEIDLVTVLQQMRTMSLDDQRALLSNS
ncbi:hypothetical protein GJ496_006002 [Pomphorhynchus laevis]|nr:hypothetical protein GJ496_006002 [Pomphorhynchus laevis]